jgi:hypothetical protein
MRTLSFDRADGRRSSAVVAYGLLVETTKEGLEQLKEIRAEVKAHGRNAAFERFPSFSPRPSHERGAFGRSFVCAGDLEEWSP